MTTMTPAFRAALIGQTEKALNAIRRVGDMQGVVCEE
jgi:hypothetical protein